MPRHPFTLDASSPSIIVPLTAHDLPGLEEQVAALGDTALDDTTPGDSRVTGSAPDAVEWRVDLFAPFTDRGGSDPAPAVQALRRLSEVLPGTPVLAPFRTTADGGKAEITPEAYVGLVGALASTGLAAAIDVEYRHPRAAEAIDLAHAHHTPVVASNHDFHGTPPVEEIVERLEGMERAGAEVAKIAVTPRSPADVLVLLDATERRYRTAGIPLITMSMGALGAVTRIGGGTFGSAATFATVGAASAPGQLPAAEVRRALDLLRAPD